jgi:cell division protein FtsI/penicillin-binding protein 2
MPLIVISLVAFVAGVVVGGGSSDIDSAKSFAAAWERQDFKGMYAELSPDAQSRYSIDEFTKSYVDAQSTATATQVVTDEVKAVDSSGGSAATFDATVDTHAFGQVTGRVEIPLSDDQLVDWQPNLVFPGLNEGEQLDRETKAPARAKILTRDGAVLAEGPAAARTSPLGSSALAISGSVGEPSRKQENELYALGFPRGTLAGTSGLELAFNQRLSGQPSGQLLAVKTAEKGSANGRILASGDPVKAKPVKTTIDSKAQQAAVTALGSTYGGVAVLDAQTGDLLGVAGLAFSAPQPPGSTFKVITASAALDAGVTKLSEEFPVESSNSEIGREIPNAHDELCGGSLVTSFAKSCNTVFAPLGVRVGGEKMVDMAEAFGFNSPPPLLGGEAEDALAPPPSTIPKTFDSDVALGESSIGQGEVLATPLQMASAAQTIANDGERLPTSLTHDKGLEPSQEPIKVLTPKVAAEMRTMMIAVVEQGTGVAADSPDYQVAGKTGTAELGPSALDPSQPPPAPGEEPKMDIDAWFTSFAPATKPKYAVAALVIDAPADGGTVAAPIVSQIYSSLLG